MLTSAIIAMVLILVVAALYMGYQATEAQRDYDAMSPVEQAAYIAIKKAKLRAEGTWVGENDAEVDFAPIGFAIALVSLCALAALPVCTVFFTLCLAAICFHTADMVVARMIIDMEERPTSFKESAAA